MNKDYKKVTINEPFGNTNQFMTGNKTVYGEMKLSAILLQDVDEYKKIIASK